MALTGQQIRALRNALVDAFNSASFEQMLRFELNKKVENIAGSGPLNTVAFKVIDLAEMEGWTPDLVRAARFANPQQRQSSSSRGHAVAVQHARHRAGDAEF